MEKNEINLFKALGVFMKEMRSTFHTMCLTEFGSGWETNYAQTFSTDKIKEWNDRIRGGEQPENLIDFGNLVIFSDKHRDSLFFRRKFPRYNKSIATYFKDIAETRNRLMHFMTLDISMEETAYNHMIKISKILNLDTMIKELETLKNLNKKSIKIKTQKTFEDNTSKTKNTSNPKTINMKNRDNKFKKSDAITLINNELGTDKISNANTVYSNINKTAPCWWLNIPPSKFKNSLNILLVEEDELIWINLPKGCCYPPEGMFNTRKDNGKVDLRISTEGPDYLKDYLSYNNFDFKPHVKNRLKI